MKLPTYYGAVQAIRACTNPLYVWSRYLRPELKFEVPLSVSWSHVFDDRYIEGSYLKIEPGNFLQDFDIISGVFHDDLRHSNFHQILTARNYAKCIYKWGELINFGKGTINETGNWGLQNQGFNLVNDLFIVLGFRTRYVLVTKAIVVDNAIARDPNFHPMWVWSRFLRLWSRLEFPRICDWHHQWEPQVQVPENGYFKINHPQNKEE